jgi:hypothetical protein
VPHTRELLVYLASKEMTLIWARTEKDVTVAMLSEPMKKAVVQIQGTFSELEKSVLVKKPGVAHEKVRRERGKCEGRKAYTETDPERMKRIRALRRKPKGGAKRMPFPEIAEILNKEGFQSRTGRPFTAQGVATIFSRASR